MTIKYANSHNSALMETKAHDSIINAEQFVRSITRSPTLSSIFNEVTPKW